MNKILIIGRNTKAVELRQTPSGTSVVEFSVAVNRTFKNANGERESDFFNCIAYNKTAELISKYVNKGDQVGIEGRLQTRNYTTTEGKKVYVTEIIVENIEFLQAKKQEEPNYEEVDPDDDIPF